MKVGAEARADMTADLRRTANECFSRLSEHLLADPDVGQGPGSGSNPGLRVGGYAREDE